MARLMFVVLLLAAVIAAGALIDWSPPTPVDVAVVSRGKVHAYVEERAKTRLPQTYKITMPLAGRIQPITLEEGDTVSKGQVVARMDPADLETDLAETTHRVGQFDELINSVAKTIESARRQEEASAAKFRYADEEFKRKRSIAEKQPEAVADADLDAAELLQFESRIEHLKDTLTSQALEAGRKAFLLMRQETVEQQQRRRRDRARAEIVSPVSGVVLSRTVSNERMLSAGEILLEIGQPEKLEVEAEILSRDALQIQVGDPVDIELPAVEIEPVGGRVARIYPEGFTKVSSLGVEQQRVLLIVAFEEGELERLDKLGLNLGVDYRVRVRIYTETVTGALRIPRAALFRSAAGGWQTFVVHDGAARLVDLRLGVQNDFVAEVINGIEGGDRVILAPESSIVDGAEVEPLVAPGDSGAHAKALRREGG